MADLEQPSGGDSEPPATMETDDTQLDVVEPMTEGEPSDLDLRKTAQDYAEYLVVNSKQDVSSPQKPMVQRGFLPGLHPSSSLVPRPLPCFALSHCLFALHVIKNWRQKRIGNEGMQVLSHRCDEKLIRVHLIAMMKFLHGCELGRDLGINHARPNQ